MPRGEDFQRLQKVGALTIAAAERYGVPFGSGDPAHKAIWEAVRDLQRDGGFLAHAIRETLEDSDEGLEL